MEWTSVKDRMPDATDEYFIYPEVEMTNYFNTAEYSKHSGKWTITERNQYGQECVEVSPTHWMPLPEPPVTQ